MSLDIVHISDLHLGKKTIFGYQNQFRDFRDAFVGEMEKVHAKTGNPALVVICGDIFDNYKVKQHLENYEMFQQLKKALQALGFVRKMVIIIGNHSYSISRHQYLLNQECTYSELFDEQVVANLSDSFVLFLQGSGMSVIEGIKFYNICLTDLPPGGMSCLESTTDVDVVLSHLSKAQLSEVKLGFGYKLWLLGDQHKPERLAGQRYYSGSPFQFDFSDKNQDKGFFLHTRHEDGTFTSEFHVIHSSFSVLCGIIKNKNIIIKDYWLNAHYYQDIVLSVESFKKDLAQTHLYAKLVCDESLDPELFENILWKVQFQTQSQKQIQQKKELSVKEIQSIVEERMGSFASPILQKEAIVEIEAMASQISASFHSEIGFKVMQFCNLFCYTKDTLCALDQRGLIAISGKNGVGKSSLFNALCFGIFGKYAGDLKKAVNNNFAKSKNAYSLVIAEIEQKVYVFVSHFTLQRDQEDTNKLKLSCEHRMFVGAENQCSPQVSEQWSDVGAENQCSPQVSEQWSDVEWKRGKFRTQSGNKPAKIEDCVFKLENGDKIWAKRLPIKKGTTELENFSHALFRIKDPKTSFQNFQMLFLSNLSNFNQMLQTNISIASFEKSIEKKRKEKDKLISKLQKSSETLKQAYDQTMQKKQCMQEQLEGVLQTIQELQSKLCKCGEAKRCQCEKIVANRLQKLSKQKDNFAILSNYSEHLETTLQQLQDSPQPNLSDSQIYAHAHHNPNILESFDKKQIAAIQENMELFQKLNANQVRPTKKVMESIMPIARILSQFPEPLPNFSVLREHLPVLLKNSSETLCTKLKNPENIQKKIAKINKTIESIQNFQEVIPELGFAETFQHMISEAIAEKYPNLIHKLDSYKSLLSQLSEVDELAPEVIDLYLQISSLPRSSIEELVSNKIHVSAHKTVSIHVLRELAPTLAAAEKMGEMEQLSRSPHFHQVFSVFSQIATDCPLCSDPWGYKEEARRLEEKKQLEKKIEELRQKVKLQTALTEGFSLQEYENFQAEYQNRQSEQRLLDTLREQKRQIEKSQLEINRELSEKHSQIQEQLDQISYLQVLTQIMDQDIKKLLRVKKSQSIEKKINQLLQAQAFPFTIKIQHKSGVEENQTDISIQVIDKHGFQVFNPSSGQRFIIDLLVKLVLNSSEFQFFPRANFIVIDETLQTLDTQNISIFFPKILGMLKPIFSSIFLISHLDLSGIDADLQVLSCEEITTVSRE